MALETLKNIEKIDDFSVIIMDDLRKKYPKKFNETSGMNYEWFEKEIRPKHFVYIRHDKNSISFTIQNGPIKEKGINGCQVDTIVATAKKIIEGLNEKFFCEENKSALYHLGEALRFLKLCKVNRENRGVEGYNKS